MRYIWLIPLLPGIGAAVNGLLGIRYFSRRTAGVVACTAMGGALGVALLAFWQLLDLPGDARAYDVVVAQWIPSIPLQLHGGAIGAFQVPWGFRLDPLSGVMMRRNIIIIFMSIELILNAVNINLVAFSAQLQNVVGQVFAIFVIAVAAAEAAVGLGIILAFYRNKETVNIDEMNVMRW